MLVIDDIITDGASKIEAIKPLEAAGLNVKDVLVILDREQGGERILVEGRIYPAFARKAVGGSRCDGSGRKGRSRDARTR